MFEVDFLLLDRDFEVLFFCRRGFIVRLHERVKIQYGWDRFCSNPNLGLYFPLFTHHTTSLIIYANRCNPVVTGFPFLFSRTILPLLPIYLPPTASHFPRDIRLFLFVGMCNTLCSFNIYVLSLYRDFNSMVSLPSTLAVNFPTPITDLFRNG